MDNVIGPQAALSTEEYQQIFHLWNSEYPIGISYPDLAAFLEFLSPLGDKKHYLIKESEKISAWLLSFDRNGGRWFSIIVGPKHQKKGMGNHLLQYVMQREQNLQGWVVDHERDIKTDGSPYPSPLDFYLKLGFRVVPDVRFEKQGISCVKIHQSKRVIES